jgi:membrane associated rhomboid family serine protease
MNIYLLIILVTGIVSYLGFSRSELIYRYQFNAWQITHRRELYRLVTHGFFHAGWLHLLVNMMVLWSFGQAVIFYFQFISGMPQLLFLFFYLTAIVISSFYSLSKHRDNVHYNAIGASGAVSAVVFASILFDPYNPILLFAIVPIPGILFGVLYLVYSRIMAQKDIDNIGHDAHFWGAVYGFVFPILLQPKLLQYFIDKLISF